LAKFRKFRTRNMGDQVTMDGWKGRERLTFVTLGMFIMDKIEYLNESRKAQLNIIGGAGTYAALGARLAAGPRHGKQVSWIVDQGSDFPPTLRNLIETWKTSCIFRLDKTRLTTTAWNGYGVNEERAFKYLTPKRRLEEHDLSDAQVMARSFHMVCSPARCMTLVKGILDRRRKLCEGLSSDIELWMRYQHDPFFVWEPVPDLCTPEELSRLQEATKIVDVVSPNAEEFASFFRDMPEYSTREQQLAYLFDEQRRRLESRKLAIVIREGAQGCTAYTAPVDGLHLPAYHQSARKVLDPTGGGNTFLGALAVGLTGMTLTGQQYIDEMGSSQIVQDRARPVNAQLLFAMVHATVSASYAIEQVGMPTVDPDDGDCWNGEIYCDRFFRYMEREHDYIQGQKTREAPEVFEMQLHGDDPDL
jgi:sugar/nucleoside kinase (ribokinase family)